jgi:ADP-dependent NAD(P)H-hydrate dehydratase / NAD(P)H-hydrate epimerase
VIPVVTPEDMRLIDAAAPVSREVLISRAGHAVAREAVAMLGGTYGRRVVVVAGPGSNGADAVAAARLLEGRGVRVSVVSVNRETDPPIRLPRSDLVIDGAYGTSFHGIYLAPDPLGAPVLAIDIPSGVDALTGEVDPETIPVRAHTTVTFAALKPGLLLGEGPACAGRIVVADIGLDLGVYVHAGVVEESDVAEALPNRARDSHKWDAAVLVIAGSPGMTGAPLLVSQGALRAGAGMVRLAVPGQLVGGTEAVGVALPIDQWSSAAVTLAERCAAVVVGPGLGRERGTRSSVRQLLSRCDLPIVVDADGLMALAPGPAGEDARVMVRRALGSETDRSMPEFSGNGGDLPPGQRAVLQAAARRLGASPSSVAAAGTARTADLDASVRGLSGRHPGRTVLTPHDGEFKMLTGSEVSPDRFADARRLAAGTGAVVLLKGPTTLVARPDGWVDVVMTGDQRLATAGTGDVLAGVIAALLAQGLATQKAAAVGAWLHGTAAGLGLTDGLVASDLPPLVASVMTQVRALA